MNAGTYIRLTDGFVSGSSFVAMIAPCENNVVVIVVDVSEHPVERQKKQRKYYSGKKKRHTLKSQIIADKNSGKIICTAFSCGKKHDFRLLKESP